ncbi:alpha/beta fold hydrolase [Pseudonocardia charpentierae]|uniref:Alpha/beta fold hydrolase n=1 Tax=Pseudonocardia charpentierae TaxID=3075545 RepID=A0ABU2NHN1_9PSEU|nr:alpha/beta fold hydrolase [Pseudonocardia sp. DSM 45834]MDT0353404.1 alpha/beta fold hydrolase [Pseudonocardia sp. DSM 45834]
MPGSDERNPRALVGRSRHSSNTCGDRPTEVTLMQKNPLRHLGARRRRTVVAAALSIAALLLINTVLVDQQDAPAKGQPTLPVDGNQIHFTDDGPRDAPALVLIYGFTGSTRSWDLLVPSLARSYRVIRIDLLGHGRSAKPTGSGYAIADQGRRVGEALDRLGVSRALVVGHSTGGSVATAVAEQRRDLVTALAFIDTGPHREAFIPQGPITGLLETPVVGQLLWRLRTDSLIRKRPPSPVMSAFPRRSSTTCAA